MENLIENKRLIAEFMELGNVGTGKLLYAVIINGVAKGYYKPEEMLYDTSWDWLMPCIGKISNQCEEPEELDGLKYALLCNDIDTAYKFVVEFTIWFNANKK